jgi:hypothetical protein
MIRQLCFLTISMLLFTSESYAHSGGLDRKGCHHDRKRGGYHCHRNQPQYQPKVDHRHDYQGHTPLPRDDPFSPNYPLDKALEEIQKGGKVRRFEVEPQPVPQSYEPDTPVRPRRF